VAVLSRRQSPDDDFSLLSECVVPYGPEVVLLFDLSCIDESESFDEFELLVVVSLVVEDGGLTTTAGELTVVSFVTVLLVTLGAAGTVVTVLLDSVEV
jgi:hypothetical protein